jgi:predicted Zn-ribbon and HTH transcriptional regulator
LISKKYNEILKNLENRIKDKRDLNIAKLAIADLAVYYTDELIKISEGTTSKIIDFENRLKSIEENFQENEMREVHLEEKISCPYCGFEFLVEYNDESREVICPKCNNLIELDWGEFEDDM